MTLTSADTRCFRYEVVGMRQNEETDRTDYEIRSSASTFVTVPYARMNQEMQRITRMGGKIVSIQPMSSEMGLNPPSPQNHGEHHEHQEHHE
jgi:sulfite reductase alpha subunit-like flavoprotein